MQNRRSLLIQNTDSAVAALVGLTIILFFTRHSGIGIEPDSVVYLSTSRNLHATGHLADFSGSHLVDFPAGYPCFLTAMTFLTGQDPLHFAPLLNALLFALLIFTSGV